VRVGGACACMLYARKSTVVLHFRSQSGRGVEGETGDEGRLAKAVLGSRAASLGA
jgi:hypothetical protein